MKVLIGCEYSGTVRDAFTRSGHDATSCDLLPSETPGKHYQGNVFDIINDGWDLAIFHPPCTYLSYAGNAYRNRPGREAQRSAAMQFFIQLWEAPIGKIAIENPLGEPIKWRPYDQLINPFNFGDNERKRTCLWLKNLPPLIYGMQCNPQPVYIQENGKKRYRTDAISGHSKDAQKERSRFYPGIAEAMATQWT